MVSISTILSINIGLLIAISISVSIMSLRDDYLYLARTGFWISIIFGFSGLFSFISILDIIDDGPVTYLVFTNLSLLLFGLGILFTLVYINRINRRNNIDIRNKRIKKKANDI